MLKTCKEGLYTAVASGFASYRQHHTLLLGLQWWSPEMMLAALKVLQAASDTVIEKGGQQFLWVKTLRSCQIFVLDLDTWGLPSWNSKCGVLKRWFVSVSGSQEEGEPSYSPSISPAIPFSSCLTVWHYWLRERCCTMVLQSTPWSTSVQLVSLPCQEQKQLAHELNLCVDSYPSMG